MFDKLIASDATGADFKPRRNYFMVSSLVVGVLFMAAVVVSIFASDYGLGTNGIELADLILPTEMAAAEPEPLRRTPPTPSNSASQLPIRQANMSRTDEPTIVPTTTSATRNPYQSRPIGQFIPGPTDTTPWGSGRNTDSPGTGGPTNLGSNATVAENDPIPEPPPIKAPPVKKEILRSTSLLNGKAIYLPKPPYPPTALAVNAQGAVDVQVMIDESGKVVSAHAVSGNGLLRLAAENAAHNARFSPTLLSNVPVKVTGVIVYNFIR